MPIPADQYYSSTENYGSYQWVYVNEIVKDILLEAEEDDDHYLKNVNEFLLYKYARDGVKELAFNVSGTVKPLAFELTETLQIVMPQDYVDWTRISIIDEEGFYQPLNENRDSDISRAYLRSNQNEIIFDSDGEPIEVDGANQSGGFLYRSTRRDYTGQEFNKDYSRFSKDGEFKVDKYAGVINFSSNLVGKIIVLEYVSDGVQWDVLKDEEIKVHKFIEQPLNDYIYLRGIERRRHVSAAEKARALNRYNKSKHTAKKKFAGFSLDEIAKAMRSRSQWNKF